MPKSKVLIVWSNYYSALAEQQLETCLSKLKQCDYTYQVETVEAGTYELPAAILQYHKSNPYDAYLPLGLLLKGETDHHDFITAHIKECFIRFTFDGLIIGNGVISAPDMALLQQRVKSGERVQEAINAVDYLISLRNKMHT